MLNSSAPAGHSEVDDVAAARDMLRHRAEQTTDMGAGIYCVPISDYLDADIWRREVDEVFKKLPLTLAFSAELPEPDSYKAFEIVGMPVLLVRGRDNTVRSFINVCRHRGAAVAEAGCGKARRFTCPYHGWTYNNDGGLFAVAKQDHFGSIDKSSYGLAQLPCAERDGIIYGALSAQARLHLDDWLGEYGESVKARDLGRYHFFGEVRIDGPNWKTVVEGSMENYHLRTLHKKWNKANTPDLLRVRSFGPHMVLHTCAPEIERLRNIPEPAWTTVGQVVLTINFTFPMTNIISMFEVSGHESGYEGRFVVCQRTFPGNGVEHSVTLQTVLSSAPLVNDAQKALAQQIADLYKDLVVNEDFWVLNRVQSGMASGANTQFTFGRNELTIHAFHESLRRALNRPALAPAT